MSCSNYWWGNKPSGGVAGHCYPDEDASSSHPPPPSEAASKDIPDISHLLEPAAWDWAWVLQMVLTATPWISLLSMLTYLLWEVYNVYTDYYGCEQICKYRKEEDPYPRNPGEHLLHNMQGSKAMLMDSLKKRETGSDKENESDMSDISMKEAMKAKTYCHRPGHDSMSAPTTGRKLEFTDQPVVLSFRKHKMWSAPPDKEIHRTKAKVKEGLVHKTVAMLNKGNYSALGHFGKEQCEPQDNPMNFSEDEMCDEKPLKQKSWDTS